MTNIQEIKEYKDLCRVDERTNQLYRDLNEIKENIERIRDVDTQKVLNQQIILNDIEKIKESIKDLRNEIKEEYVKKIEFSPVQKAVFAVISMIVVSVLTVILNGVFAIPPIKPH